MTSFHDLGLSAHAISTAEALGFAEPTPIQSEAIPLVTRGRDVIGQAQTGSGKTAAFGLPMIDFVDASSNDVQALVLTPTRELAIQVAQALRTFGETAGVRVVAVFGGQPIREQTEQLKRHPHIAVGTPGRVMDMMRRGWLQTHSMRYLVLDEADEMLSLGFIDDVEWILGRTPSGRQTMLFSATMPPPIQRLAERYMFEPQLVKVESLTLTVDTIRQISVNVEPKEKLDALCDLLGAERPKACIVFRKRKIGVDELVRQLRDRGLDPAPLHGGMSQGQRDGVMLKFRSGRSWLLVATNVAARGLDISHVSHVISYDIADDPEDYTHRIGRTGRVGRSGLAYTFATRKDQKMIEEIERVTGARIERMSAADLKKPLAPAVAGVPATPMPQSVPVAAAEPPPPALAEPEPEPELARAPRAAVAPTQAQDGDVVRLFISAGRRHGVQRDELAAAVAKIAGLEPARVRVQHAFSHVDVPAERADEIIALLDGAELVGRQVRAERAQRQPGAEPATAA